MLDLIVGAAINFVKNTNCLLINFRALVFYIEMNCTYCT